MMLSPAKRRLIHVSFWNGLMVDSPPSLFCENKTVGIFVLSTPLLNEFSGCMIHRYFISVYMRVYLLCRYCCHSSLKHRCTKVLSTSARISTVHIVAPLSCFQSSSCYQCKAICDKRYSSFLTGFSSWSFHHLRWEDGNQRGAQWNESHPGDVVRVHHNGSYIE